MTYAHPLAIQQRVKKLKDLIEDCKKANYSEQLIESYEQQLKVLQEEIDEDKKKRDKFYGKDLEEGK